MNDVNQLLEQEKVTGDGSDTRTNHNAVESLLLESGGDNSFCGLAKIGEAKVCVVAQSLQVFLGGGQPRHYLCCGHARESSVIGIREINKRWFQSD